jgi:hypothetical protein
LANMRNKQFWTSYLKPSELNLDGKFSLGGSFFAAQRWHQYINRTGLPMPAFWS